MEGGYWLEHEEQRINQNLRIFCKYLFYLALRSFSFEVKQEVLRIMSYFLFNK